MDGETNGTQEVAQGAENQAQQEQQQKGTQGLQEVGDHSSTGWEKKIADRDARIAELEGQVVDAAKNAETAESLRCEIAELRQASEDARIDFKLQLAGCRNVKAARAVLADHDNDVDKLKTEEPWLFNAGGYNGGGESGTTGLPNAGAAKDTGKQLRHWRAVVGLTDDDKKKE